MHINALDVKGFGKLKDRLIPLINGLNIIYGDNEAGKTTLQWFVKGMLYGLKSGRKTLNSPLPPVKRFEPWDGGPYGGAMLYTLDDGSAFRVERNFKTGIVRLFDGLYNDIAGSFEIGKDKLPMFAEKQLGMDEETFDRTALIRQMEVRLDTDSSAALADRLANMRSTGCEDISYQRADKALADAIKNSIGTDRTRVQPLDKLQERLEQLKEERARLEEKQKRQHSIQEDLLSARRQRDVLEARERYLEHIGRLIETRKILDANLKKEAELKEITRYLKESEKSKADPRHPAGNRLTAPVLCFSAAVIFALMLGFAATAGKYRNLWVLAVISAIGLLISGTAGILLFIKRRKADYQTDRTGQGSMDANKMYEGAALIYDGRLKDRESVYLELDEISRKLEELSGKLDDDIEAARNFNCDIDGMFKQEELDAVIYDSSTAYLETAWKLEIEETRKKLIETSLKEKYCEGLLKNDGESTDLLQRVEEETVAVKEKIDYLKSRGEALKLAREVLAEAGLELKRAFTPDIDIRMSEVIAGITGGRYADLRGNDRMLLNAAIPESGDVKNILSLSGATVDQMYLALRLALTDLLTAGGESLPLLMDEVFSQFDDKRTELALKYLHDNYMNRQILIFTCKRREVELAGAIYGDKMNFVEL